MASSRRSVVLGPDCVDSIAEADADLAVVVVSPEIALETVERMHELLSEHADVESVLDG